MDLPKNILGCEMEPCFLSKTETPLLPLHLTAEANYEYKGLEKHQTNKSKPNLKVSLDN